MEKVSLVPATLSDDLVPIAHELDRLHESAKISSQAQFEQTKFWRLVNVMLGVPAATLAGVAGGTGLAARGHTATPAILALLAAAFGAALTTVNPSRRTAQAQAAGNAYLEIQTAARQYMTIDLAHVTREQARAELTMLTARRDDVNRSVEPFGTYAYGRAKKNIRRGGQDYAVDVGSRSS